MLPVYPKPDFTSWLQRDYICFKLHAISKSWDTVQNLTKNRMQIIKSLYRLTGHFISCILLVQGWTPLGLRAASGPRDK